MRKFLILISLIFSILSAYSQIRYTYDNLGRLTQAAYPDSTVIKYTYDASGNRVTTRIKNPNCTTPKIITFAALKDVTYGKADFSPGAKSNVTTIPLVYTSDNQAVATITAAGKIHIVGAGNTNITASQPGDPQCSLAAPVTQPLTVLPTPLTITADDKTRIYNTAGPAFTLTYSGFVYAEGPARFTTLPVAISTAAALSPVGTYPITPAGAVIGNYAVTYIPGTLTVTPADRNFTFNPLPPKAYLDPDFDPGATVEPAETIIYTSSDANVVKIVNGNAHITGAGTATLTATISVNANYVNEAPLKQQIIVAKASQTVTFQPIKSIVYGVTDFLPVTSSTNSTVPVAYSSDNPAIATITAEGKIHTAGTGTVNITAIQAGNANFEASQPVSQPLVIAPAPLTIAADNQARAYKAADPTFTVSYTGFVNGDNASKLKKQAVVTTNAIKTTSVGTYPLTPATAESDNYSITYVPGTLTVTPARRSFVFGPISGKIFTDPDFDPGATIDDGGPITYTSADPAVATIAADKIHITGTGIVAISARVPQNPNYIDEAPKVQQLTISRAPQTITFDAIPVQKKTDKPLVITVKATASSGLPVTLTSSNPAFATVSGLSLTINDLGNVVITAVQAGNAHYLPATASQALRSEGEDGSLVLIHRLVSPNGDGINDVLLVEGIKDFPDNKLTIVNRNGVKVFEMSGYNNDSRIFDGHSSQTRAMLPLGTYFYTLQYRSNGQLKSKTDYFILKL